MSSNTAFNRFSSLGLTRRRGWFAALAIVGLGGLGFAAAHPQQLPSSPPAPSAATATVVSLRRAHAPVLRRTATAHAILIFQVRPGFHINSNHPNSPFLIPTTLRFNAAHSDVVVQAIRWPQPQELKFQFSAQPLAVFSGTFPVRVDLRARGAAATLVLKGTLRYQACNDTLCRPPASLPVHLRIVAQ
ncbi:MAG: protein-disulfide reductase DsbD domain-containing protein [Terriglobales bacterium]